MGIHNRIIYALDSRESTQKQLCHAIEVSPSTLNNWLKFNRSIPSEFVIPICEFLGIDVRWLLTGEGVMNKAVDDESPSSDDFEDFLLRPEQTEMLDYFDKLPPYQQGKVVGYAKTLLEVEEEIRARNATLSKEEEPTKTIKRPKKADGGMEAADEITPQIRSAVG